MKMSMKKILALILAGMLAVTMTAAAGEDAAMEVEGPHAAAEAARPDLHPAEEEAPAAPAEPVEEPAPAEPAAEPAPAENAEEPAPAEPAAEPVPAAEPEEQPAPEEAPAENAGEGGETASEQGSAEEAATASESSGEAAEQPQDAAPESASDAENASEQEAENASAGEEAETAAEPEKIEVSMQFGEAKVTVTAKAGTGLVIEKLADEELEKAAAEALGLKEGPEALKVSHLLLKVTGDAEDALDVVVEHAGIRGMKKENPSWKVTAKVVRMKDNGKDAEAIPAKVNEQKDEVSFQWTESGVYDLVLRAGFRKAAEDVQEITETDRSPENAGDEAGMETGEAAPAGDENADANPEEAAGDGAAEGAGTEETAAEAAEAEKPAETAGGKPVNGEIEGEAAPAVVEIPAAENGAEEAGEAEAAEQEEETAGENPAAAEAGPEENGAEEAVEVEAEAAGQEETAGEKPAEEAGPEKNEAANPEEEVIGGENTEADETEPGESEEQESAEQEPEKEPERPEVIVADAPYALVEEEEPAALTPGDAVKEEEPEEQPEEKEESVPEDGDDDLSIEDLVEEELTAEEEPAPAEEEVPFSQTVTVDGVYVTVTAEEGAFPAGSVLSVTRISASRQARVDSAVAEHRAEDEEVAASYFFDIKVLSPEGEEIQPVDGKWVRVAFSLAGVADPNLKAEIYHMRENEGGMVAEELAVTEQGTTAEAATDGFSIYSLMLTYQVRTYTMLAGSSASMRDVMSAVGLYGDPSEASISGNGSNFALEGSNLETWRLQAAAVPDEGEQSLLVKLNGISYQIPLRISGEAQKEAGIQYKDERGLLQSWDGGYSVANTGIWQSSGGYTGWWVVEEDTTINQRVMVSGDVRLILTDGVTLTVNGGIQVAEGNRLTIYGQQLGTGMLKAVSFETTEDQPIETGAGIGGAYVENGTGNAGEIAIHGGHVIATAGMPGCAGIGGGTNGRAAVTITGGTVTATGNWNGPGIGGLGAGTSVALIGGNVTGIGGLEGGEGITGQSGTAANGGTGGEAIVTPAGEGPDSGPSAQTPGTTEAGYAPDGSVYTGETVDYKTQGGSGGATYQWNSSGNSAAHITTGTNVSKPTMESKSTSLSINSLLTQRSSTGQHLASSGTASGGPGSSDAIVVNRDETTEASQYNAILITLAQPYAGMASAGAEEPTLWDSLSQLGTSFTAHSADVEWSDSVKTLLDWGMQGMDREVYPSLWNSPSAPVDGADLVRVAGFTTPNESSPASSAGTGAETGTTEAVSPLSPVSAAENTEGESGAENSPAGPGSGDSSGSVPSGDSAATQGDRNSNLRDRIAAGSGKHQRTGKEDVTASHTTGKTTGNGFPGGFQLPEGLTGGSSSGSSASPGSSTESAADAEGPGGPGTAAETAASEGPGGAGAITGSTGSEGPGGPGSDTQTAASEGPGGVGSVTVSTDSEGPGGPGAVSETTMTEGPGGPGSVGTTNSEGPGGAGSVETTDTEGPGGPGSTGEAGTSAGPGGAGTASAAAAAEDNRTDEEILSEAKTWMETSADELTERGSRYFLQLKLAGPGPKGAEESDGAYLARKLAWEDEMKSFLSWLQTSGRLDGMVVLYTVLNGEEGAAAPTVPMVMIHPDVAAGTVVTDSTGHRDVLPTLVDLGRADQTVRDLIRQSLPGKSLMTRVTLKEKESPANSVSP